MATADLDKKLPYYSYTWTKNGVVTQQVTNSRNSQSFYDLRGKGDKGDVTEVSVIVSDSLLENATTNSDKAQVTIRNSAPVMSTLLLAPYSPTSKQVATSTYSGRDDDGDKFTKIYKWRIGINVLSMETGSQLDKDVF